LFARPFVKRPAGSLSADARSGLVEARDLNPGPHGPELCELSSRNARNDRFLFETSARRPSRRVIWGRFFAGLLHKVLHERVRPFEDFAAFTTAGLASGDVQ
jgi:hypothetical protein